MPQIVNTNISSLNAQRNLNRSQDAQSTALQRLSSGLRINSAKDDAAGLTISTRFDAQIKGTSVAVRNSGDAISLAQTAEGALDSINTSLQRVRELALQSANDTNTSLDRAALQEEVSQLISEIQNVAKTANFNGKKLLDGSFTNASFQTGANIGDTVKVSISKVDADSLGSAATSGVSSNITRTLTLANAAAGSDLALVAGDLTINGIAIQASDPSTDTASRALAGSSAIAKAAAINAATSQTGVTATANENTVQGTILTAVNAAVVAGVITINGTAFTLDTGATSTLAETKTELTKVAEILNEKSVATGVKASVVEADTGFRIDLVAADGRNIDIHDDTVVDAAAFGMAASGVSLAASNTYLGNVTLTSKDGSDIVLGSTTDDIDNTGFEEGTFSGTGASVVGDNSIDATRAALTAGDLTINGSNIGITLAGDDTASTASESASAIALAAAINRSADITGVTAKANANVAYSTAVTAGASTLVLNGTTLTIATGTTVGEQLTNIIDGVNAKTGQTGIRAEALDGDQYRLIADDGRNIQSTGSSATVGLTDDIRIAGVTLQSGGKIVVGSNTANIARSGLTVGTFGGSESGSRLADIDITTVAGAEAAVAAADNAINTVASRRAELGAIQNRFANTISNLEVTSENLSAANSRIKDADFASETAALSRSQVLQQAGISILSQANARPQQVLSLLQ